MIAELSHEEFGLLQQAVGDLSQNVRDSTRDGVAVEGTTEEFDEWRDLCSDLLQIKGFNSDYQPTQVGRILERLIDQLYIG